MDKLLADSKIINYKIRKIVTARNFRALILKITMIIFIIYIISTYVFGFHRMKNNSMTPTATEGSLIIYYRIEKKYSIGDVIMYSMNNNKYIARVIATEGQTVDIDEDGKVYVDGHDEDYIALYDTIIPDNSKIQFPYKVKENSVFVLQDYRSSFQDSRIFGSINVNKIEGKTIGVLKIRNI